MIYEFGSVRSKLGDAMGTKSIQIIIIVVLLILICYNLLQNDSCQAADKTEELINKNNLVTKRFLKAMQTDGGSYNKEDFLNPLIRSGKISNRKNYLHLLKGMSEQEIEDLVSQFHVNGTKYLDSEAKRDFLWCDPELLSTHSQPVRRVYRPCTEMRFKQDSGKRVALASFPGSGSTWSRTLLEQATGVYTGAIYCDKGLKGQGFVGEFITSRNVIVIKTHQHFVNISNPDRKHTVSFDAVIFIIRNVFDAVFSERKRSASRNHTGQLNKEDFGMCMHHMSLFKLLNICDKNATCHACMQTILSIASIGQWLLMGHPNRTVTGWL